MTQKVKSLSRLKQKAKGYGMALISLFLVSSITIGMSLQMMSGPITAAYMSGTSQGYLSAQELAQVGLGVVSADIQNLYNTGQSITTSYSFTSSSSTAASNSVLMPQSPDALSGGTSTVGSYTGSIAWVYGNQCLVKVVATVNGSSYTATKMMVLSRGQYSGNNLAGATAMYGLRKLSSSYSGSAIQVRRASDNATRDIGFLPNGDLDTKSLLLFLGGTPNSTNGTPDTTDLSGYSYPGKVLDQVGSASRAYGLRKLRAAYTGYVINVRRSNDSATQDIGFMPNGDLDTISLLNFCGSNSCYVTTWYDQSGNGVNATQATTASQPSIVTSGVINTVQGRPSIKFDGADDRLTFTRSIQDDFTIMACFSVVAGVAASGGQWYTHAGIVDGYSAVTTNDFGTSIDTSGNVYAGTGNPDTSISSSNVGYNDGRMHRFTFTRTKNTGQLVLYTDAGAVSGSSTNINSLTAATTLSIGALNTASGYLNGSISEVVLYGSVLSSANQQLAELNQGWYYGLLKLMSPSPPTGVSMPLDTVTGATAAFSVRKLRTAYADSALKVRRSNDNATQNIGFDASGNLDTTSLKAFCGVNSCYIDTWYDQSGNGNNATQATAANQPRIVNAGTVETFNSRPTVRYVWANSTYLILASHPFTAADGTFVGTVQSNNQSWARIFDFNNTSGVNNFFSTNGNIRTNAGAGETGLSNMNVLSTLGVYSFYRSSGTAYGYRNGSQLNTSSMNALNQITPANNWFGRSAYADPYLDGAESEMIFYASALSTANRQLLENSQGVYYNVPSGYMNSGFVTKWYDQSGNGYDLSQSTAANQPTIRWEPKSNRPVIYFDGVSTYLSSASTLNITSTQATAFAVANMASSAPAYGRIFSAKGTGDTSDYTTTTSGLFFCRGGGSNKLHQYRAGGARGNASITPDQMFQATSYFDGTSGLIRVNGVVGASSLMSGNFGIVQLWMGASPLLSSTEYWLGTISEAILYQTLPTTAQIQLMERDQRSYYGTP